MAAIDKRLRIPALLMGSSLACCAACIAVATWDAYQVGRQNLPDALRVFLDPESTEEMRHGARGVISRDAMRILDALQLDRDHPQSARLLRHIHEASR